MNPSRWVACYSCHSLKKPGLETGKRGCGALANEALVLRVLHHKRAPHPVGNAILECGCRMGRAAGQNADLCAYGAQHRASEAPDPLHVLHVLDEGAQLPAAPQSLIESLLTIKNLVSSHLHVE